MPVLKNPYKLKMAKANRAPGGTGELILAQESSTNPFEEDLEENLGDSVLGDQNPFLEEAEEEGGGFERDLFNGRLDQRRVTLEKLVGLSPFRLGKGKKGAGKEKAPAGDREPDRRSFLGLRALEKRKARRSSEDFSLLQLLNGRRRESPGGPESSPAEREGVPDAGKRMSFLKLGLGGRVRRASLVDKPSPPEAPEPALPAQEVETVAKTQEPLSVLEILNLIQQRDLLAADKHIIELEAECGREGPPSGEAGVGSRKAKDVALLYEALLQQLWAVLAEALAARGTYPSLELVVQVIEQEEAADRRWLEVQEGGTGPRPRAMRRRWAEEVKRAVAERLGQCAEDSGGPLAGHVERLTRCLVEDLRAVRSHLLPAYPPEYQALDVYARSYHEGLAQLLGSIAQRSLSIAELYFLLDWHSNTYPREVLGRLDIAPLLSAHELEPLLPPDTQHRLEEACAAAVKTKIVADMSRELREEEQRWAQEPGWDHSQLELSSRVISVLKAHVDKAPQITLEFGEQIVLCCLTGLAEFLQSFQSKVEQYHEGLGKSGPPSDSYVARTIALVNCCPPFRKYMEQLAQFGHPESDTPQRQASTALDKVTRLCNRVLAQQLFEELRPYFPKLMKRKWLTSSESFDAIIALLTDYAQKLQKMLPEPYEVLVNEVHRQVLVEYVRPLLQVRLVCSSNKMRGKVAARLEDEGRQLQELFIQLNSTSSWLNEVVPHLAEILRLEDTPSIQMEVGVLVRDFPDIRKKHVAALLDVRGLRGQAQRQEILAVVKDLELSEGKVPVCRERAFFSEIPAAREVRCFSRVLPRLPPTHLACLGWLHWGCLGPPPDTCQPQPSEHEAETQV
ncbi:exocyst complex component 3-like protein 2 isoform X1 [Gopherus evgoodei]|uniref:exocyst complex component 3-like protein 2 isoform X1 n=2 Tax=Gopherus evgoodei TaxID=1825980 RepID=UPI0011CFFCC3|nr:exocyst complex component 3-like protein 2 isoform X1 [Gopherus evgoodei]XP_030400470.1 exocyst complex component 3-like protein 2 isoform X1 [Gopherus evgoodei]XP_030400471.1 exocyst complex component 3-like protein 2 isoform X1 [Gopherus evgoodei]XP_030400472.1 exocyst complex component 3-like protein 2 isoform X1 [Gopherus evgoodei]